MQQEELADLKQMFHVLDVNHDGALSLDELRNGLGQLVTFELFQNHREGEENCYQKVMDMCDLDGDGKIDYLEFI